MKFRVTGKLELDLYKEFEAESLADAEEQVESWETWGGASLLDFMECNGEVAEFDAPERIKAKKTNPSRQE